MSQRHKAGPQSSCPAEACRKATPTPGPWKVIEHNHVTGDLWLSIGYVRDGITRGPVADIVHKPEYLPVAELKYLVTPEAEQRANAALIASAPDLAARVAALEEALGTLTKAATAVEHAVRTQIWQNNKRRLMHDLSAAITTSDALREEATE